MNFFNFKAFLRALIFQKLNEKDHTNEIFFEFYLVSANVTAHNTNDFDENRAGNIANYLDFENLWIVAMRVLMIFEDLLSSLPGFFGEIAFLKLNRA